MIKLLASRDESTDETYVPPRAYAADGSLRPCTQVEVDGAGVLYSWTSFRGEDYGIIDLKCGSRVQSYLGPGPHAIGSPYVARELVGDGLPQRARFFRD